MDNQRDLQAYCIKCRKGDCDEMDPNYFITTNCGDEYEVDERGWPGTEPIKKLLKSQENSQKI